MYVSIRVNSSAMNSYLEYMHGPTGTENRRIITIDALYRCCVMADLFQAVPGTLHRAPAIIHALTHGTVSTESGTSNCGITFLWPPVTSISQNLDSCLWHTLWMKQQNLQSWKQYAYVYFFFSLTLLRICENEQFEFQTVTFRVLWFLVSLRQNLFLVVCSLVSMRIAVLTSDILHSRGT